MSRPWSKDYFLDHRPPCRVVSRRLGRIWATPTSSNPVTPVTFGVADWEDRRLTCSETRPLGLNAGHTEMAATGRRDRSKSFRCSDWLAVVGMQETREMRLHKIGAFHRQDVPRVLDQHRLRLWKDA